MHPPLLSSLGKPLKFSGPNTVFTVEAIEPPEPPFITKIRFIRRDYVGGIYPWRFTFDLTYTDKPDDLTQYNWRGVFSSGSSNSAVCIFGVTCTKSVLNGPGNGTLTLTYDVEWGEETYVDLYYQLVDAKGQKSNEVRTRVYR